METPQQDNMANGYMAKLRHWNIMLGIVALVGVAVVMIFSVLFPSGASGQEGDGSGGSAPGICALGAENIYAKANTSLEDTMELYHDTMNKKFNEFIAKMLAGQKAAAELGEPDKNNNPPENGVCDADNYSTWCVAETLLGNGSYGYMEYFQALQCRKTQIFDTVGEQEEPSLQGVKALEVSNRISSIEREIRDGKQTLDTTLAAYEELKTAWPMHKRYMTVYGSLLKYRDKMVDIRSQVEAFPAEFIDATTTQCT